MAGVLAFNRRMSGQMQEHFSAREKASVKERPLGAIWPARDRPAGEKNPA